MTSTIDMPTDHQSALDIVIDGLVGRSLRHYGMKVGFAAMSEVADLCEINVSIAITNPEHPGRGTVLFDDDGSVWWRCTLTRPEDTDGQEGVSAAELTKTIGDIMAPLKMWD